MHVRQRVDVAHRISYDVQEIPAEVDRGCLGGARFFAMAGTHPEEWDELTDSWVLPAADAEHDGWSRRAVEGWV
jgi:hypothetical protein